jgi:oxaloacetate decarboxylase alpha subunit
VKDRIVSLPRARELAVQPAMPGLAELRKGFSPNMPDEEFILRATMPADQVDAMKAAGDCRPSYDLAFSPVEKLLGALVARPDVTQARVEGKGFRLSLNRREEVTP